MSAAWMIAAVLVSALVAVAALSIERVLMLRRGAPLRWTWVAALALAIGLSARLLLPPGVAPNPLPAEPTARIDRSTSAVVARPPLPALTSASSSAWARLRIESLVPHWSDEIERMIRVGWGMLSASLLLLVVGSYARLTHDRRSWRATFLHAERVLISDGFGPALVGVLRPVIVVPPWVLTLDASAQRTVLAHEDEHRRAHDPRLLLGALLALVMMPWNVGLWVMWRRLGRAIELDCDARVIRRGVASADYAEVLLTAWQRARGGFPWVASPALAEHVSGLGRRIEHLLRPTPRSTLMTTITGSFACALLMGATLLVPTPPQAPRQPMVAQPTVAQPMVAQPVVVPDVSARTAPLAEAPVQTQVATPVRSTRTASHARQPAPAPATAAAIATVASDPESARAEFARQQRRGRILIAVPLDSLGAQVARALYSRIVADTNGHPVYVIPQEDFEMTLRAAGFTASPNLLNASDLRASAQLTRADLVVALATIKTDDGLRAEGSVASGNSFTLRRISDTAGTIDRVSDQVMQALRTDSAYVRLRNRQP